MFCSRNTILLRCAGMLSVVASSVFSGCTQKPEGTLSEGEMISLMADMQLAEAYSDIQYNGASVLDERRQLAKSVLEEHGVTQAELDSTLSWYGRNLDDYSALFEKVNVELRKRKKNLLKLDVVEEIDQADILWPYSKNGVLSTLGNRDGWLVSIDDPAIQKGDMLEWSMHLNKTNQLTGTLGVDYSDGTGEAVTSVFSGRPKIELRLQTDTGKTVKRIYGSMRLREWKDLPLFADSINLRRIPFDSLEFKKYRNQKRYGIPARIGPAKKDLDPDSITGKKGDPNDSIIGINVATGTIRKGLTPKKMEEARLPELTED